MTRHAELGASRAERWMHCPGSVRMSRQVPDVDTVYAAEGRLAHAAAEKWLKDGGALGTLSDGTAIGDDMRESVRVYVDYVRKLAEGRDLRVEVTFDLSPLEPPEPMFGTADAVITGRGDDRRIDVVDFKYGAGVPVEVNGNTQLLYYVLGALLRCVSAMTSIPPKMRLEQALASFDQIWVHIVQPRAPHADGPVRTAFVSKDEIRAFAGELMIKAAHTQAPDAPLHAGTWCKFCPAQAFCPEVKRYAIALAQRDFTVVEPPPAETLPLEVIASVLTKVDVLEHWVASLKARVQAELEAGRPVPGWKLVAKRPRRVWNNLDELQKWQRVTGVPLPELYTHELKSPAQVEEIVGKKNLPPELYSLVSTGHTLAPDYDRRPALTLGPQQDFTALPAGPVDHSVEE